MTVQRFGVWRAASALLIALATAVVSAWAVPALKAHPALSSATIALLVGASVALGFQVWRLRPMSLRWDTQRWHLGLVALPGVQPLTGRVNVAFDLGVWVLLYFKVEGASAYQRGTWVPVQRRGHEAAWHAFRCTAHGARPATQPSVVLPF